MRGRLIAVAIVLAVLAFAEIRHDDQAPAARRQGAAASGQVGDQSAPEPGVPAIITAAVSTSATMTILVLESRRQLRPALSAFTVSRQLPVVAHSTGKPRFFPLLI